MKKVNQKLRVFMVPNGQGGFRQESYSSRKNTGSSSTVSAYRDFFLHDNAWRFERKLAKNSRNRRDLIFPATTVLDDIDAYYMDFPDDDI